MFVSGFSICLTIRGCINTPLLAIAETALINWIGVIVKRCPKETVASSTGPTELKYRPVTSPDVEILVFENKPNAFIYL